MESYKPLTIVELFFISMICGIFIYVVVAIFSSGSSLIHSLFPDPNDIFMDFFNSIYDSTNSYSESGVIYPPFINLCFRILSFAITPYAANSFDARLTFTGAMYFLIFVILIVLIIHHMVNTTYKWKRKNLLSIIIIFSMPFLFCLERGNVIILAALLLLPFIQWYDSEDKRKRYFAYLCLALSINIKLYPIIFCLLVLRNKQYREFLLLIFITALIFFISLLLLNDSLIDYIVNVFNTSNVNYNDKIGISAIVYKVLFLFGVPQYTNIVSIGIMAIVILLSIYLVMKSKSIEKWKNVTLLSLILCTCGSFNVFYCLVYMFVPLILFLNTNPDRNRENLIYVTLFVLMMIPLIGFHSNILNINVDISQTINVFIPIVALTYLLTTELAKINKNQLLTNDMASTATRE